ncbi:creatininase family protein [Hoeflea sp.]|uniref:creatininase family protein n=1 Tax=Hoeflea sp. TaxID=1940281 RepID=UPI003B011008
MNEIVQRNFSQLTWTEIRDAGVEEGVLVVPVGSVEQHGPHLAVDCDLVFADRFLDMALAMVAPEVKVWRLPILPFSKSNEHLDFPGTIWLSAQTLTAVISDICRSAKNTGFRKLVFWNCHGGNRALLEVLSRDMRIEYDLKIFQVFASSMKDPLSPLDPREPEYGIHAGEWETSVMMAIAPDRVREDKLVCEFPDFKSDTFALENAGATMAWKTSDLQKTGTFGDATGATAERGQARMDILIPKLAAILTEIESS